MRIHGIVKHGGDAANITPDRAVVDMSVRARNAAALAEVYEKVKNCAKAGALATGATAEFEEGPLFKERVVLQSYRRIGLENFRLLGIEARQDDPQTFASADSGNVSYEIPHLTFNMPVSPDPSCVPHTPEFAIATDSDMARDTMNKAAKLMAMNALDVLMEPSLLAELQAEHAERVSAG